MASTAAAPAPARAIDGRFIPGTLLAGRYRLVALLGRGGMGEVYRADDTRLGQTVALKFLPDAFVADAGMLERFYAEVRVGRQVSHPNVVRLYDLVEVEGHHCLSMEFVDGEDLSSLLERIGRVPAAKALEIARDVAAGLAAAHDRGVIHRDLKPANVMIDGKGRARIADFGIAALAGSADAAEFAGTPAYLAPELLDGQAASVQSDLYALGLVLFEICCGQRLYSPRSLAELRTLQAATSPRSLVAAAPDVPPALQRVVLWCLEQSPQARPASAHAVLAALPGGNALDAAVAAGETPSPAMVAAAETRGDLQPVQAWCLLLAAIAGLALLLSIVGTSTLIGRIAPARSTELLADEARGLLAGLGYGDAPADAAGFFDMAFVRGDTRLAHDAAGDDPWQSLHDAQPTLLRFVLRQSPRELAAAATTMRGFAPGEAGRVTVDDPPPTRPGMRDVTLDARGRLVALRVIADGSFDTLVPSEPDWRPLLRAAGIDDAALLPVAPPAAFAVPADRMAAWSLEVPHAGPLQIEAGALRGRPVWFRVGAAAAAPRNPETLPLAFRIAVWTVLGVSVLFWTAIAVMVRRNLRQGRGDRQGALRLTLMLFWMMLAAQMLRADHVATAFGEVTLVTTLAAQAVLYAGMIWVLYIGLEPIARRRWPRLLVGWSRLLSGRWRDPLVGRDVLLGAAAGIAMTLVVHLAVVLPGWLGLGWPMPRGQVITSLSSLRHLAYFLLMSPYTALIIGLGTLLGVFVNRAILRSQVAAVLMTGVWLYFGFALFTGIAEVLTLAGALFAGLYMLVMMRGGLLAAVAAFVVFLALEATPLTADLSRWYADRTIVTLTLLLGMLGGAFWISLGGRSPLGNAFVDRDALAPV